MKIRSSLRKMCEQCKIITRGRKNYVICKGNPRHKQRQGYSTMVNIADGVTSSSLSFNTNYNNNTLSTLSTSINPSLVSSWLMNATTELTTTTINNNNHHESIGTGTLATLTDTSNDIEDV